METLLKPVFSLLTLPDLKLKRPGWISQPSANQVLFMVLVSYFLVTGENNIFIWFSPTDYFPTIFWFWPSRWNHLRRNRWASKHGLYHRRTGPLPPRCLHAIPDQWPIHHGRTRIIIHVHTRWEIYFANTIVSLDTLQSSKHRLLTYHLDANGGGIP